MNLVICGAFQFGQFILRWGQGEIYAKAGRFDVVYDLDLLMIMTPAIVGGVSLLATIAAWIFISRRVDS